MRRLAVLVFLSGLTGCAGARHTVHLGDVAEANRQFAGRAVTVVLTTGAAYPAEGLRVAADSTSWVEPVTGDFVSTPTSGISEIRHRDRGRAVGRSVGRGAIGGAIGGAVAFGAVGYDSGGCIVFCSGEPSPGQRMEAAVGFGLFGAAVGAGQGALYGLVVGALSDPVDTFVIEPSLEGGTETAISGEPAPAAGVASDPQRPD